MGAAAAGLGDSALGIRHGNRCRAPAKALSAPTVQSSDNSPEQLAQRAARARQMEQQRRRIACALDSGGEGGASVGCPPLQGGRLLKYAEILDVSQLLQPYCRVLAWARSASLSFWALAQCVHEQAMTGNVSLAPPQVCAVVQLCCQQRASARSWVRFSVGDMPSACCMPVQRCGHVALAVAERTCDPQIGGAVLQPPL